MPLRVGSLNSFPCKSNLLTEEPGPRVEQKRLRVSTLASGDRLYPVVAAAITLLLVCITSWVLASSALAQRARPHVSVTCQGALPFSTSELIEAIQLRLPLMRINNKDKLPAVRVQGKEAGRAAIHVGSAHRVISLGGLANADAARVVALLALDLISNLQREASPKSPSVEMTKPRPKRSDTIFVGVSPRLSVGVSEWSPAFEPTLDLGLKITRNVFAFVEAGFTWIGTGEGEQAVTLIEIPARLGAALRYRWFELRAGVTLRPYFASGGKDDQGVLVGGGGSLRVLRKMTAWLTGYLAGGVDLFAVRKDFRVVQGETALRTSWVVPWLGVGAGWEG
jgi:hypothetical protein